MCQCGCGDTQIDRAFKIGRSRAILAYQIFSGCKECSYGPGVGLSLYDSADVCYLEGVKIESVVPDEYGANKGFGIGVGLFDMEDLRAEAKEIGGEDAIGPRDDQYATLDDWLSDHGQDLITGAIRRYQKRRAESEPS